MTLEKLSNKVNHKRNIYRSPQGRRNGQHLLRKLGTSEWGRSECTRGGREEMGEGEKNLREWDI